MFKVKYDKYVSANQVYRLSSVFTSLARMWSWIDSSITAEQKTHILLTEESMTLIADNGIPYRLHQIETEKGIIYSDGEYTNGQKFCSTIVKEWISECNNKMTPVFYDMVSESEESE